MNPEKLADAKPRVRQALGELRRLVQERWPTATLATLRGDDPDGWYLRVTVDIEDPDVVIDAIGDRLLELEVDQGLPVYVVAVRPLERVLDELRTVRPERME